MANNPYVNKVIYGNDTIIDLTSDTVTPADVASGKTFHDASGTAQAGSYVAPVINDVTPSNLSPVSVNANENYRPTSNGILIKNQKEIPTEGAVVETYAAGSTLRTTSRVHIITNYTEIIPSNASPVALNVPNFYKVKANSNNGYAIESYSDITPSNSDPVLLTSGSIYKATVGGKAVASVSNLNSNNSSPDRILAGNIYKGVNNGYAVITQPIVILPDNDAPVRLTSGQLYAPAIDGYAIHSYSSKTPDDITPPPVSNGDIVKINGAGYMYKNAMKGPRYTKTGTAPNFSTANQEQTIDTGLSNITYFYVEGVAKNYGNVLHRAWLDLTITDGVKQVAVQTNKTATTANAVSSGTDANGLITANNNYLKVSGISGGTVTIKGSNSAAYAEQNVKWYAG